MGNALPAGKIEIDGLVRSASVAVCSAWLEKNIGVVVSGWKKVAGMKRISFIHKSFWIVVFSRLISRKTVVKNPAVSLGIIEKIGIVLPVDESVHIVENRRIDGIVNLQPIGPEIPCNDIIPEICIIGIECHQSIISPDSPPESMRESPVRNGRTSQLRRNILKTHVSFPPVV